MSICYNFQFCVSITLGFGEYYGELYWVQKYKIPLNRRCGDAKFRVSLTLYVIQEFSVPLQRKILAVVQ